MIGFRMPSRLLLLAEPRSGSSWLMETLNSHPGIDLRSEILNHKLNDAVAEFIDGGPEAQRACLEYLENQLSAPAKRSARFSGCKVLLNHLTLIGRGFPDLFIDFFQQAFFIFLFRENLVLSEISVQLAHRYDIWHVKKEEQVTLRRILLEPPVLIANLERNLRRREKMRRALAAAQTRGFSLSYEELFSRRDSVLARIISFLGLDPAPLVASNEKKGNPFRPEEVIENFADVRAALQPYPQFLKMLLSPLPDRGDGPGEVAGGPLP